MNRLPEGRRDGGTPDRLNREPPTGPSTPARLNREPPAEPSTPARLNRHDEAPVRRAIEHAAPRRKSERAAMAGAVASTSMELSEYTDAIATASAAIAAAARIDLSADVPACPGWQLRDLVTHMAQVQGWATAQIVKASSSERAGFPPSPAGLDGPELLTWAEDCTTTLLSVLNDADPDGPAWTFGAPRTARFWFRRQAIEAGVHAWDGQSAIGTATSVPGDLAADGLDEFLDLLLPRMMKASPGWVGETVHLHRTDGPGEWLVTLGPDGSCDVERAHAKGSLAIKATASDLLLWACNRRPVEELESFGDLTLASRWQAAFAF